MTQSYTSISKPGAQNYTSLSAQGKQQYDQPDLLFDSAGVFYDSVNAGAYTSIAKPVFAVQSVRKGMATGLSMPLTQSADGTAATDYTYVPKPN